MAKNAETRTVQLPAMLAVGGRQDVLCWRQQSGTFRAYDDPQRVVKVGLPGMADAGMVVAVKITEAMVGKTIGVLTQAEFKTSSGRQSEAQRNWQAAVEQRGGVYRLVRSEAEMLALVDDVQAGNF
jgi:hypothetical protein